VVDARTDMSLPRTPIRIGLVGCGRLAEFGYIPALRRASEVALVGVADVNPVRCSRIAPEVPAYASLQDLIDAGRVQAVIISTPTRCHLADATIAAEAKLPSLVEKPPGIDLKEAEGLLKLIPKPCLGFNRRFDPDLVRLKNRMQKKEMRKLRLELCYRRNAWNPFDMQDDALLDLGPHLIDLVRWLTTSEVTSVKTGTLTQHYVECEFELENGQATIICCCNSPYREKVSVSAKDGRVLGTYRRGGILAGIIGKFLPHRDSPLLRSLVGQLEAFSCAVQGLPSAEPLGSVVDGVKVMTVIEAARSSARSGGSRRPVWYPKAD
jgi:myo-inositol 2-dehydrogenase / D-chiro-inositol 1-dehydrogenase